MKEKTSMNVWKESFLIEIRFLTRKDDLRKVTGNWTWPETGPHTVLIAQKTYEAILLYMISPNCHVLLRIFNVVKGTSTAVEN